MFVKLTTNEIANELANDEFAGWTHNAARALAEWIEETERDLGEEWEFDRVALRCDFSEYETPAEALAEYDHIDTLDDLRNETAVIDVQGGGVIVQNF